MESRTRIFRPGRRVATGALALGLSVAIALLSPAGVSQAALVEDNSVYVHVGASVEGGLPVTGPSFVGDTVVCSVYLTFRSDAPEEFVRMNTGSSTPDLELTIGTGPSAVTYSSTETSGFSVSTSTNGLPSSFTQVDSGWVPTTAAVPASFTWRSPPYVITADDAATQRVPCVVNYLSYDLAVDDGSGGGTAGDGIISEANAESGGEIKSYNIEIDNQDLESRRCSDGACALVWEQKVKVEKRLTRSSAKAAYSEGDTLEFEISVTNTGQADLIYPSGSLTDTLNGCSALDEGTYPGGLDAAWVSAQWLESGATFTYPSPAYEGSKLECTITAADVARGGISNVATLAANGTNPFGKSPPVTIDVRLSSCLRLLESGKTVIFHGGANAGAVVDRPLTIGEQIKWLFVLENCGNVALDNIEINHSDLDDPISIDGPLAPSATTTIDSPIFTVADDGRFVGGTWRNISAVSGNTVASSGLQEATPNFEFGISLELADPCLDLTKTVTPAGPLKAGDDYSWNISVTNCGNIAIDNVEIDDPSVGGSGSLTTATNPTGTLAPGDTSAVFTVARTATAAQAGTTVSNTATATGVAGPSTPVSASATAEVDVVADGEVTAPTPNHKFNVVMSQSLPPGDAEANVGDTVTYTFTISNIGDSALTDVVISDPDIGCRTTPLITFGAGLATRLQCTYVLTAADEGTFTRSATVGTVEVEPTKTNSVTLLVVPAPTSEDITVGDTIPVAGPATATSTAVMALAVVALGLAMLLGSATPITDRAADGDLLR